MNTTNKQKKCSKLLNVLGLGEECECEELCLKRGSSLACRVMCFVSSSAVECSRSASRVWILLEFDSLSDLQIIYSAEAMAILQLTV